MARPLDDRQQAELSAFVNELADLAGYKTTAEWARDSGYPASNLSTLRNGVAAVDGYNLLRLIRAAAERAEEDPKGIVLRALQQPRGGDEPSNAEIALRLEALSILVSEGLARLGAGASLEAIQQRLEEARDQESASSTKRERR